MKLVTIKDVSLKDKTVFLRAAFDVPLDSKKSLSDEGRVRDDSRIRDIIPTLKHLINNNCKVILEGGWLGRPKGEDSDLSMAPVSLRLQSILKEEGLLKHPVLLTPNCLAKGKPRSVFRNKEEVRNDVSKLLPGQVILLENVRYDPEANSDNSEFSEFIASLAGNGAVYVNDAEAQNHRPEATIISVPRIIVKNGGLACLGLKVADVFKYLGGMAKLLSDKDRGPFLFFLSGKKIETQVGITSKITVAHSLLDKMRDGDSIIAQGGVTYTFLVAQQYFDLIGKYYKDIERIINYYNGRISKEALSEKDSQRLVSVQASLQHEKSEKIKELLRISDDDIRRIIGNSFVEWKEIGEQLFFASKLLLKAKMKKVSVITAIDHFITNESPDKFGNLPPNARIRIHDSPISIPQGWLGVAPGLRTIELINNKVEKSLMIILAGPLSIEDDRVEEASNTNKKVFSSLKNAKASRSVVIGAGGDTSAVIKKYHSEDSFTVISNAGGATLELLEKGTLPGIEAVINSGKK